MKHKKGAEKSKKIFILSILAILVVCILIASYSFYKKNAVLGTSTSNFDTAITVDVSIKEKAIPERFLGLSFEKSNVCKLIDPHAWDTPTLQNLLSNLGPIMIRVGGNTADHSFYNVNNKESCSPTATYMTLHTIKSFFSFATTNGVNAGILWTLNLPANKVTLEAHDIYKYLSANLWGIAIGNEPDLYSSNHIRCTYNNKPGCETYTFSQFLTDWHNYAYTLYGSPKTPPAHPFLIGNDYSGYYSQLDNSWVYGFASKTTTVKPYIHAVDIHYYPTCNGCGIHPDATIENLLSRQTMADTNTRIQHFVNVDAAGKPVYISETNSTNGGGKRGVSDTFSSALWGIDYLFTMLQDGVKTVNFHTGTSPSLYSPITNFNNGQWIARPLYYAMLLFRFAAPDGSLVKTATSSISKNNVNVVAYSVLDSMGVLKVVVVNKDLKYPAQVQLTLNHASYKSAVKIVLEPDSNHKPNSTATAGIRFGNQTIQSSGLLGGNPTGEITNYNGQTLTTSLDAASAAVIVFQ